MCKATKKHKLDEGLPAFELSGGVEAGAHNVFTESSATRYLTVGTVDDRRHTHTQLLNVIFVDALVGRHDELAVLQQERKKSFQGLNDMIRSCKTREFAFLRMTVRRCDPCKR